MSQRGLRLGLVLLIVSQLGGCLLFRVYEFKEQFCDYQRNFRLLVGDEIELQLRHPVLLDSDMVWLLGAEPSYRDEVDGELELVYIIEKDLPQPDPAYALPLRLQFSRSDGDNRLSAGIIDKNLGSMITPGLIDETMTHTCDSQTSVADRNVTVDLSDLDPAAVPTRRAIEDALGPPNELLQQGHLAVYRFRLRNARPGVQKSRAEVWYGENGQRVRRVRFRYLRYELDADFVAGVGIISIDL